MTFSQDGQWIEVGQLEQSSWLISGQSRMTSLVLFLKLSSVVNANDAKWLLIYHDQVSEQNYRRLCRAIIFQQQKMVN